MSRRTIDHTADLGIEVEADEPAGLFSEALAGFTDAVTPLEGVREELERNIEVSAPDLGELMVEFLEEALYLFETEGLLFRRAEARLDPPGGSEAEGGAEPGGGGRHLRALCRGEAYDAERHPLKVLIKGVTYHHLVVREGPKPFARIIFDI